ncbi:MULTISPECIES: hypothetical protein [Agrobacterium]|uniref:Nucleotidyl transferase AbiEii/AbiGii toxin family protein n=1 Tax=Agrobacterium tumefaciens TaxID=358 RepID=A0AAE6BH83_AGRTU|nr:MULTISPECIES: hypothetical protein [Agrobacterium]QCL77165.1 hypothetical protein CFBP5499_27405 [Agrobacterium tumefaciens]QCL82673.1 hypothetical protein CFBP5877_26650 [Agrobacterium tumefaciens]CUX70345.1 conserved hypothetical protein [Agrobacterium sp. NCPPB 925]
MTEIREQLLEMLKAVATALGDDLRNRLVFVGGCTTALFITDPVTLEDVRSTDDIDLIVDLAGLHEWAMLLEDLRTKGFVEAADDDVICRMRLGRLKVDFMPDDEAILGFSNRWYATGIETAQPHILDTGLDIKVLTPPASRDAEDLLLMVDGREELLAEISAASDDVRQFTAEGFRALLANSDFDDFLEGNLRKQPGRSAIVKARYVTISQCDGQNAG